MKTAYDVLIKYQKYLLGLAIFLSLTAVSITMTQDSIKLNLANRPVFMLFLVSLSILLALLYIRIDKNRMQALADRVSATVQDDPDNNFRELLLKLTDRQEQIYHLIISGKSNKEIMSTLFIEQSTLKTHINQIYKKLNVRSRREIKIKANQHLSKGA